ncbi:MAG TPA: alpha/beta hydrolase [Candidatus Limnocylindrales bacterium]|nr:alpha/beta hydrolase [Candidatus Limnocylindrales bacterium]
MDGERYRAAEQRLWASLGVEPTERQLRLRHLATDVRIQEVGDGQPVVFVHGANTSGSSWASIASRLPTFRCILVDRPGTGLSPPPPTPIDAATLPAFAEHLIVDVLDALDLSSAHVVGTSFGGYVALRSAAAHPDRVDRLILFSWSAGLPVDRLPLFMRLMTMPGIGRIATALPQTERSIRQVFRGLGHAEALADGRITREDIGAILALYRDTDTMRNELTMGRALVTARGGLRMSLPDALLGSIRTPTYLLWGEDDPFGGPDLARAAAGRLPNATLELLRGAGHAPWLDDLERCVEVIEKFLGLSDPPRPASPTPGRATGDPSPSSVP